MLSTLKYMCKMESWKEFQGTKLGTLCLSVIFIFTFSISVIPSSTEAINASSIISRNHVSVWFDYSVRYYEHEADNAYSKEDLRVMVDLVSTRFGKMVIGAAPVVEKLPLEEGNVPHSRILVPLVVAEHNRKEPSRSMQVIVSFGLAKIFKTTEVTSFDVAKYMADQANDIYPGTVTTLMMDVGSSIFSAYLNMGDTADQLKLAREKTNKAGSKYGYTLATFMTLRDCGHFKGPLGQKAKDYLPHVEMIALLLSPNFHHFSFDTDVLHKMFITKFEECEKKLKEEKPDIKVVPAVIWLTRVSKPVSKVLQGWGMMSNWAEKTNREVIFFEAYDTPNGRLLSDQGWWKLRDKAEHKITKDLFIEKIQGANYTASESGSGHSSEDNMEEYSEDFSKAYLTKGDEKISSQPSPYNPVQYSIYIALILLVVVCTLLTAVIAGLVYGFQKILKQNNFSINDYRRLSHNEHRINHNRQDGTRTTLEDDDGASLNGSMIEIRETVPITAVTYINGNHRF